MRSIDLNCDLGESFGFFQKGNDENILPYVTSANIACGFHAGDPATMRKTVTLAMKHDVSIGAHPGFQDLLGFGRREINMSPEDVYDLMVYQIGALEAIARTEGAQLNHVKPHGALYNMAAKDRSLAEAIAKAVYKLNKDYILYGLAGSELIKAGQNIGLKTANEVFADRTYQMDGSLTPRSQKNALIKDVDQAIQQVLNMIQNKKVRTVQGELIDIQADTICIHGDKEESFLFAKKITEALKNKQIEKRNLRED